MSRHGSVCSIDYYAYQSPAGLWNPRLKLIFAAAVLVLGIVGKSLWAFFYIVITMAALNIWKNKIEPLKYMRLLCIPFLFVLFGSAAIALEVGFEGQLLHIYMTKAGVETGIFAALRSFSAISALYFLALSTPMGELVVTLRSFHMPGVLAELMHLTYRYIFILMDTERAMRYAAKSRLGYVDFKISLKTFGRSLGNLFIVSLVRAERSYDAMSARCYDGEILFMEEEKRARMGQVVSLSLYIVSIVMVMMIFE